MSNQDESGKLKNTNVNWLVPFPGEFVPGRRVPPKWQREKRVSVRFATAICAWCTNQSW